MADPRICVLGSLNMDLVVRAPRLPAPGETLLGGPLRRCPGGKGANQAVAAARMGASVSMIGCVGEDDFGRALLSTLDGDGVASCVRVTSAAGTGVAVITVDESGENTIVVDPGANALVDAEQVRATTEVIERSAWLVAQLETPLEALEEAIRIASPAQTRVLLNAAPARALPRELLERVDVLVVNYGEAARLAGRSVSPQWMSRALLELGPAAVVVTLGEEGALAEDAAGSYHQPSAAVVVRDSVGAGDAFVGGLAAELARGATLRAALPFACVAGALAATRDGARSAPNAQEVRARLADDWAGGEPGPE